MTGVSYIMFPLASHDKHCIKEAQITDKDRETEAVRRIGSANFGNERVILAGIMNSGIRSDRPGGCAGGRLRENRNGVTDMNERYCFKCGTELVEKELKNEGRIPWCPSCEEYRFSMFNTAVSMIVINEETRKILLIKQYGRDAYILVAGYVNRTEDLETAVRREIREETGMQVSSLRFNRSSYFAPSNTLMVNFTAWVKDDREFNPNEEIDSSEWFTFEEARKNIKPESLAARFLNAFLDEQEETKTLAYYETNADRFVQTTQNVGFSEIRDRFLSCLKQGDHILEFGCGSGRDAKAFLEAGYRVTAIDGSKQMCEIASSYIGQKVRCMRFEELDEKECYEGIFACASILHARKKDLPELMRKMCDALKPGGVMYVSFRYGDFEGTREGRYFSDFTEKSFRELIGKIAELSEEELWISQDVRKEKEGTLWLNAILRKKPSGYE